MSSSSTTTAPDDHAFIAPKDTDSRAPCPALNALANHGYLPRDGRNISLSQLLTALQQVYNISVPLSLTLGVPGIVTCGRQMRLDLEWLAAHNVLEHDASLVHADAAKGSTMAPIPVDPALLKDLLSYSSDGQTLSLKDWANVRADKESKLETPLGSIPLLIAHGEVALSTKVMQSMLTPEGTWPLDLVKRWFGEERLPEGWRKSDATVGLTEVNAMVKELNVLIRERNKRQD